MVHPSVIVVDQLHPLSPKRIALRMARHVGIEDEIERILNIVLWPSLDAGVPPFPPVRIQVVDEARPTPAHKVSELVVALRFIEERLRGDGRVDTVALSESIVEHEGDLLEMRGADVIWEASGDGVEAVAVGREPCGSPSLACLAAGSDEVQVAEVGGAAAELGAYDGGGGSGVS